MTDSTNACRLTAWITLCCVVIMAITCLNITLSQCRAATVSPVCEHEIVTVFIYPINPQIVRRCVKCDQVFVENNPHFVAGPTIPCNHADFAISQESLNHDYGAYHCNLCGIFWEISHYDGPGGDFVHIFEPPLEVSPVG